MNGRGQKHLPPLGLEGQGNDTTRTKHSPSLASLGGPPVTPMWPCLVIAELLRTAPELLWGPGAPGRGTLRGGTFSISIVL